MNEVGSKPPPEEFIQQFAEFVLQQDLGFLIPADTPFEISELNSQIAQMMMAQIVGRRGQILTECLNLEKQLCFLCGITNVDGLYDYDHSRMLDHLELTMGRVIQSFSRHFPWDLFDNPEIQIQLLSELEIAKNIRNRFAHDLVGFVVYRHSYATPYLPVLLGKNGIMLINDELLQSFSKSVQISQRLINQLRISTGKFD